MTLLQTTDPLWTACEDLLRSLQRDHSTGMISQRTMQMADQLRRQLWRDQEREAAEERDE